MIGKTICNLPREIEVKKFKMYDKIKLKGESHVKEIFINRHFSFSVGIRR